MEIEEYDRNFLKGGMSFTKQKPLTLKGAKRKRSDGTEQATGNDHVPGRAILRQASLVGEMSGQQQLSCKRRRK